MGFINPICYGKEGHLFCLQFDCEVGILLEKRTFVIECPLLHSRKKMIIQQGMI